MGGVVSASNNKYDAEEEEMRILKVKEKHELKERLEKEAEERRRREGIAKRKADMQAMLDAEEEEIRILKKRAKEKADLKTKLEAELQAEEGVEMQLQALALEREEEKDNAKKTAAI